MTGNRKTRVGGLVLTAALFAAGGASAQFSISGTVTDPLAAPVDSTEIRLYDGTGIPIGIPLTYSNTAGSYTVPGLPSGSYIVEFRPPTAKKLLAMGIPTTIAAGNVSVNAALQLGHILSGFVRDENGVGIPNIDLQARDRDTRELILTPGDDTDASGFYDVVLPTGEFDLEWRAVAAGSLPWIPFTTREVIAADTTFDVTLFLGVNVSGLITNAVGTPIANVNLDFTDVVTGIKALTPGDNTALDGTFTAQVPEGTYEVVAKPTVLDRLVAGIKPTVVIAGDVTGLNFVLQPGHLLSGIVSGPGGVVEGVDVDVFDLGSQTDVETPFNVTDLTGLYQIVVPAGSFEVTFSPLPGELLAPLRVPLVNVAADAVLNASLPAGVVLSGTITAAGLPVPGTDLDLKDRVTGVDIPLVGDGTDALGIFSTVVVPGIYHLEIEPPKTTGLVAQLLLDFAIPGPTNLPVSLVAGVRLSGQVRSPGGLPLSDVNVDVLHSSNGLEVFTPGDHTNVGGLYDIVIPTGTFDLKYKLGVSYSVPDSVVLASEIVTVDRIIDVVFTGQLSGVGDDPPLLPAAGRLRAHPNPFNPVTRISFELAAAGPARLSVHGLDGRRVATIADRNFIAGRHEITWDGRDTAGRALASGVYLVALTSDAGVQTHKIALVK